jgi:hypothetical protein
MALSFRSRRGPAPAATAYLLAWWCSCAALTGPARAQQANAYGQKTRTFHSADAFTRMTGGKVTVQRQLDPQQHVALRLALTRVPTTEFTVIAVESPSVTWVGTRRGAIRLTREYQVLEYFAGQPARRPRDRHGL